MTQEQLEQTLEALLAFLRSECCAAEVYRAASDQVRDPWLRSELDGLRCSHEGRAYLLRERLGEFGGVLVGTPGEQWGAFSNVRRKLPGARDDGGVLTALCEGEALAVRDYEIDLCEVEPSLRRELADVLLFEQRRTRERVATLSAPVPSGRGSDPGAGYGGAK